MHGPSPLLWLTLMPHALLFSALAAGVVSALLGHRKVAGFTWGWVYAAVPLYAFALTDFVFYQMNGGASGGYDLGAWVLEGLLPFLIFSFVTVGLPGILMMRFLDLVSAYAESAMWAELVMLFAVATGVWFFLLGPQWRHRSNSGQLTVVADPSCSLAVNGVSKVQLTSRQAKNIQVGAGILVLDCTSYATTTNPPRAREIVHMPKLGKLSVELRASQAPLPALEESRFGKLTGPEIRDDLLRVVWTQSDNGRLTTSDGAVKYCESLGSEWRLPAVGELMSLADPSKTLNASCGKWLCAVSSLFLLGNSAYWGSSEFDGAPQPFGSVVLVDGHRDNPPPRSASASTLCVRSASGEDP